MGMSNGANVLHRVALEINGSFYYFRVNPQNITESFPARNTFAKTEGTIYMQGYGLGLHTIQISGTTGWGHGNAGVEKYVELKNKLLAYTEDNQYGLGKVGSFYYHDFTNGYSWQIELSSDGFKFTQSVDRPLLYDFDISMAVIKSASMPSYSEVSYTMTGNASPSLQMGKVLAPLTAKYTKPVEFNITGLKGQTGFSEEWDTITNKPDTITSSSSTIFNPHVSETAGLFGSLSLKKVMGV